MLRKELNYVRPSTHFDIIMFFQDTDCCKSEANASKSLHYLIFLSKTWSLCVKSISFIVIIFPTDGKFFISFEGRFCHYPEFLFLHSFYDFWSRCFRNHGNSEEISILENRWQHLLMPDFWIKIGAVSVNIKTPSK